MNLASNAGFSFCKKTATFSVTVFFFSSVFVRYLQLFLLRQFKIELHRQRLEQLVHHLHRYIPDIQFAHVFKDFLLLAFRHLEYAHVYGKEPLDLSLQRKVHVARMRHEASHYCRCAYLQLIKIALTAIRHIRTEQLVKLFCHLLLDHCNRIRLRVYLHVDIPYVFIDFCQRQLYRSFYRIQHHRLCAVSGHLIGDVELIVKHEVDQFIQNATL